ncbi:MAG TPA: hypothetical protein VFS10_05365 [Pyrinomonadaceae bacterium]|nr:hypothetical protein [Pyrinomonadaceae bacterium]
MLFVGTKRDDLNIPNWSGYFHPPKLRRDVSFWIQLDTKKRTFADLDADTVRDFREYSIPTIEITLTDETTLDEIITLFVDINQQGVKVDRFSIVKAMGSRDKLLQSTFNLIALTQKRGEDVHYRVKANEFTHVLKTLRLVENTQDNNAKVDRMWERLLEVAMFFRSSEHRKPVEVLKGFIRAREQDEKSDPALKVTEARALRKIFKFLREAYRNTQLKDLPLATDYTHFYAMITGLIAGDLLGKYAEDVLTEKLIVLGRMIEGTLAKPTDKKVAGMFSKYMELSAKRTTEASRREERQQHFLDLIDAL